MHNSQEKNKWKQIFEIVSLYGMSIILVVGSIYLELSGDGFSPFFWVGGVIVVAFLIAGGTKGLLDYQKSNLPSGERNLLENQQHYNKLEKRKKQYRDIKRKDDSMLKEFSRNSLEYHFQMNVIIFILGFILLCIFFWKCSILPTYFFWIAVVILAIVLIICWIHKATGGTVKRFEKMILASGYDFKEVDFDYMHGTICVAMSGYLCIGQQYSVYCSFKDESFIIPHQEIIGIEKRIFTEKVDAIDGKFDRFHIRIYTDCYSSAFMTDDIGADVVLQEYEKRGVKTRTVDMR